MAVAEFMKELLDDNEYVLMNALEGLTAEELHRQPDPDSNPIGWLMWHLSRTQDRLVAVVQGLEEEWFSGSWYEKFGRDPNPRGRDTGRGQTPEEMRAFRAPNVATLSAYYEKVRARTNAFLDSLTDADLERPVPKPGASATGETVPMTERLSDLIRDNVQHTGQIAYLRGLIRGNGWLDL